MPRDTLPLQYDLPVVLTEKKSVSRCSRDWLISGDWLIPPLNRTIWWFKWWSRGFQTRSQLGTQDAVCNMTSRWSKLRKPLFHFLSNWMGHDRGDSFPFDFEPNGIPCTTTNMYHIFLTFLNISITFRIEWDMIVVTVFFSHWMGYDRGDSFPFKLNGIWSKGNMI